MTGRAVVGAGFLQVLWFAVILGVAHDRMAPAWVWFVIFCGWHFLLGGGSRRDVGTVALATALGVALDSAWLRLGWLGFNHPLPLADLAPYWIAMLWAGVGLSLNHGLQWLQQRPALAAACAAASAPLSYLAAARLGAVDIFESVLYPWLSLSWAIVVPALLLLARRTRRPEIIGQPL